MSQLQLSTNRIDGTRVESRQREGREWLVAPVVMIVEGVLNGELVPADEFSHHAASWNGRPAVLDHPMADGEPVSANDPGILERIGVGQIFNVTSVEGKLKAEAWVDVERAGRSQDGRELVRRLRAGDTVEVSTAYWRDLDAQPGEHNGQAYNGTARNLKPDHLAFLLHEVGACSVADGCGCPRVNVEDGMEINVMGKARRPSFSGTSSGEWSAPSLSDYESAYDGDAGSGGVGDRPAAFKRWVAGHSLLGDPAADNYRDLLFFPVVSPAGDLYESALMAVIGGRGAQANIPAAAKESAQNMARRLLNSEFDRDLETERDRGWIGALTNSVVSAVRNIFMEAKMDERRQAILDSGAPWDAETLGALTEDQVTWLHGHVVQAAPDPEPETNAGAEPAPEPAQTPDVKVLLDEYLADLGGLDGLKAKLAELKANEAQERAELVARLKANQRCALSEAQLERLDTETLQGIEQSLIPADYRGQGGGPRPNAGEVKVEKLAKPRLFEEAA